MINDNLGFCTHLFTVQNGLQIQEKSEDRIRYQKEVEGMNGPND